MNTSKQVNAMIGLLFLAFLAFGAYIINEPNRQATAEEAQSEMIARRGADLFVNNCRSCHGLVGEGGIAPALDSAAFLILGEDNPYGVDATAEGEARTVREFLFNTIACGRTNTVMPLWSERYGGSMSETQVNYIVDMITSERWDLVEEIGVEHDIETSTDPATVVLTPEDAGSLSATTANCGQYTGAVRQGIVSRDPFADPGEPGATQEPGEEPSDQPEAQTMVQGALVGEFYANNCASCHGGQRQGAVGPALTPQALTEPDDFYADTIANGRGTIMPAWSQLAGLTDEEVDHLVQFIKHVEP
ncbi:MAG: c-type cytochrome [Dehalococcoidia bacterium]|nr:c-type cytochrome [Dehalococcoidia bacterium]